MTDDTFDIINQYTRRQALADGVLIDASATAREAGITYPVALTAAVHDQFVRVSDGVSAQDERGRLWDILWLLRVALRRAPDGDFILFTVYVRNDNDRPRPVKLKAACHPGDEGEPVITVLLPDED